MKRYAREEIDLEDTLRILSEIGTVVEISGWTARVEIGGKLIEIQTAGWIELKEAE